MRMIQRHQTLLAFVVSAVLWLTGGFGYVIWTSHGFDDRLAIYVLPCAPYLAAAWAVVGLPLSALLFLMARLCRRPRLDAPAILTPGIVACLWGLVLVACDPPSYGKHFRRNFKADLPLSATHVHIYPKVAFHGTAISYDFHCSAEDTRALIKQLDLGQISEGMDPAGISFPGPPIMGVDDPDTWVGRRLYSRDVPERQLGLALMTDGTLQRVRVDLSWMLYKLPD